MFSVDDKLQLEEQLDRSIADSVESSDDSIIKPVQLNRNKMFDSPKENNSKILLEHIRNNFNRIHSAVSIEEVKSNNTEENCDRGVHSISDSEEEEETSNDMGEPVQALAAPTVNDEDDDDVVVVNSRPRTPRPIVVSDDEDDSPVGES